MLGDQRVLAVVPARAGSKGLPRKNVALLGGRPLVGWTFAVALACPLIDTIVASTDDGEVADLARGLGIDVLERPAGLAGDATTAGEVIMHALDHFDHDVLVYLQPTSPFREATDITACLQRLTDPGVRAVVSVSAAKHPPQWMMMIDKASGLLTTGADSSIPRRRQDAPDYFELNGAVYCARREDFEPDGDIFKLPIVPYVMERSIDIDTAEDLAYAEFLLQARAAEHQ